MSGDCKTCGTYFHACGSCGSLRDWEWDFCSERCSEQHRRQEQEKVLKGLAEKHKLTPEAIEDILDGLDNIY